MLKTEFLFKHMPQLSLNLMIKALFEGFYLFLLSLGTNRDALEKNED